LLVCLTADPDTILRRVSNDTTRPLLAGNDKKSRILSLLASRVPLYGAIPHQVDTTRLSPEQAATQIVEWFRKESQSRGLTGPA
jgi:shikimate kinase